MRNLVRVIWIGLFTICTQVYAQANEILLDRFENEPEKRWEFFSDTVMGGVSTGRVSFRNENGKTYARMTGEVSTKNRGGFIQFRRTISKKDADGAKGVRLIVRGNNQQYFVHLRTSGTILPWQYYQGNFETTDGWNEIRIPLSSFKASGRILNTKIRASSLKSIGIVAYGRNHKALVDILEIGLY